MNTQDRFADLWTDYLEGELSETGLVELRELLAADERLVELAADLLQTHRLLGLVVAEEPARQDEFIRETLAQLPESQDEFVSQVMSQVERGSEQSQQSRNLRLASLNPLWMAAAVMLVGLMLFSWWPNERAPLATEGRPHQGAEFKAGKARLVSVAQAKFFGELSPPVGSVLAMEREYVLMSGLIEVAFPAGATAILEGPAVFRVTSDESLALDVGQCSVHAPDGAEGFRVETPVTRVVDRGTRFTVSVGETSDTEVHVIEGAADVYDVGRGNGPSAETQRPIRKPSFERLTNGQARRFVDTGTLSVDTVTFNASAYRRELPDRVISYEATKAADGGAEDLESITVQRGGQVVKFSIDELIAARVTWFKATESRGLLCGGARLPASRAEGLSDRSLVTGVINPDGSLEPLTADPVMEGEGGTPGMAIRFERPVSNGPGADVVFFELQTFVNPSHGDAFHVSPLAFREGLKSHTIRKYDLTMESPEALDSTNFYVHFLAGAVESLGQLKALSYSSQKQSIQFRVLAVGIDLSDLGYASGDTIEGLFIQDALDDGHRVDPVFIAGLPEMQ